MSPKSSPLVERSLLQDDQILDFRRGFLSMFKNIRALKKYCQDHKIDLIHGHDSHAHSLLWMAYRFGRLEVKSVVSRRLINPIKDRSIAKYNHKKIERIICISKAVKQALAPKIVNTNRLIVIQSGIIVPSKNRAAELPPKESKDFVVGYVAAFTEEKDHETFIATARHLMEKHQDQSFHFLLVGSGPLLETMKRQTASLKASITFTGFVEDVEAQYKKMDVLLHTSKSEALGTAILDALKYEVAVVATECGGIKEIISHKKDGFLAPIGDYRTMAEYIHKLATQKDLRTQVIQNASEKLQLFDKDIMISKTLDTYKDVLHVPDS